MKNKKLLIAIFSVVALIVVTITLTYAFWTLTKRQEESNVVKAGCIDFTITGESADIVLENQSAIYDAEGAKLTPYEFTLTNNCSKEVDYVINLESTGTSSSSLLATSVKVMFDTNLPKKLNEYKSVATTIENAYDSRAIAAGTLSARDEDGSNVKHALRVWISSDAPASEAGKIFKSKISVTAGQNVKEGKTLGDLILDHATINGYLKTTTPSFTAAIASNESGLYKNTTSEGDEYYFRGMAQNNYVKFGTYRIDTVLELHNYGTWKWFDEKVETGDSMYWRIVKINADGSIRLAYDGLKLVNNQVEHQATMAHGSYNDATDNIKYVGYVYDNNISSSIKKTIDTWYQTHLLSQYDKYIADSIFCNDRSISANDSTKFAAYDRLNAGAPTSECPDDYKLNVASGKLRYPIALLTADEMLMAGVLYGNATPNSYLNSKEFIWTMTPSSYASNVANMYRINRNGRIDSTALGSTYLRGIRPVINIKASVHFTGSGSVNDPYELVYE